MPERLDTGAMPMTEPHSAPIFDTGPHPAPLASVDADESWTWTPTGGFEPCRRLADDGSCTSTLELGPILTRSHCRHARPSGRGARAVPVRASGGSSLLLMLGVWTPRPPSGWVSTTGGSTSIDKTWTDFAVLVYVIVCMVAALLVSMVEPRPMLSAPAVALMSAPFASACAAAALYGAYAFGWLSP